VEVASLASSSLVWRLGVCIALAMSVMLLSLSFHFGLSGTDGLLHGLSSWLALGLSTGVVAIGSWPFFRSAARGLRRGVLQLDLPIALGVLLIYAGSLIQVFHGRGGALTSFDTLNAFVTLMVLGRLLQQRLLERNRQRLIADDGADGICVQRIEGEHLVPVRAPRVEAGDRLLVAPGQLVPVDAELIDGRACVSTDWINGAALAESFEVGATIPAGSFNSGDRAMTLVAQSDFAESPLVELLRRTDVNHKSVARARRARVWDGLVRWWGAAGLAIAGVGLLVWLPRDPARALDVAVALLVVTCPCAIAFALPLGYQLARARLRRAGFFACSNDVLDRLARVRRVVFDKTGTPTLNLLELGNPEVIEGMSAGAIQAAYNLTCRSAHPAATCLAGLLLQAGARFDARLEVTEIPGQGLLSSRGRDSWWFGRERGPRAGGSAPGTVLARNGDVIARFDLRESLRPGAATEVEGLRADGYDVWLLSEDPHLDVAALAFDLGIPADHALGRRTPARKACDVARLGGAETLYLGDGVNDALAFEQALCAGTVALDRPVLPGGSDFFLLGGTLAPLREALACARKLRHVARRVVAVAIAYSAVAVTIALLGLMSPLHAVIFMPLSSLAVLLFTVASLRDQPADTPLTAEKAARPASVRRGPPPFGGFEASI
jgi:Cu2+-exporting ATPase